MRTVEFRFNYIITLFGAMFDFADVTESGVLCGNIQFNLCVFCPLAIVIQEIHRNTNGIIFFSFCLFSSLLKI